jgi:hypothetical protein
MGNLFTELMRRLFALLDGIVAWAIELLYVLLIKIADTNVFGELIYQYLGRIYTFLGIFMVFKLSFAMINYIINPDTLTDKGKGFSKLITNVVISLILLAITPNLFDAAFKLQSDLLSSNAVYQIVTGKKLPTSDGNSNKSLEENAKVQGKEMSYAVYSSFIYKSGGDDYELEDQKICEIKAGATCLLDEDVIIKKDGKKFTYEYKYLISTICGCAVAYMLLMFCFDAAVRSVKLGFLQIIAPIPILSMIDPGKGTDKVSKWGKECGKTFIDLFIRLAGIFFALDVIHSILSSDGMMTYYSNTEPVKNLFVRLFVIIGCLMFAKQLPNLIESILGIKLSGDGFSLKKKLGNVPGLGVAKAAGAGALGFAGGMAANTWATRGNWKGQGLGNGFRNVGSILAGGMSGAGRGLTSKEKNLFKAAGAGVKGSVDARNLRAERYATGEGGIKGWGSRRIAGIDKFAGVTNDDTAKIAAQRELGEKLWEQVNGNPDKNLKPVYTSKYDIPGIGDKFKNAWEITDKAKDYRNSINSQLSMARSDFQAGKDVQWGDKTGAAAIAALEVESAKASAAYDKASADFKELRSMQEHKSEATYYDAYNAADDRHSAESYSKKTVTQYTSSDPKKKEETFENGAGI